MYALSGLGDVFLMQGNLRAARKQYDAARVVGEQTKADAHVALFDLELGTIDLIEQHLADAEARARHAAAEFEKDKDPEGNAKAYALLVEILLAENKEEEAIEVGKRVESNAAQVTSLPPQFEAALAQLDIATGKPAAARKRLLALLDRARRSGYMQSIFGSAQGIDRA